MLRFPSVKVLLSNYDFALGVPFFILGLNINELSDYYILVLALVKNFVLVVKFPSLVFLTGL